MKRREGGAEVSCILERRFLQMDRVSVGARSRADPLLTLAPLLEIATISAPPSRRFIAISALRLSTPKDR
jgi:hypothetical protein